MNLLYCLCITISMPKFFSVAKTVASYSPSNLMPIHCNHPANSILIDILLYTYLAFITIIETPKKNANNRPSALTICQEQRLQWVLLKFFCWISYSNNMWKYSHAVIFANNSFSDNIQSRRHTVHLLRYHYQWSWFKVNEQCETGFLHNYL